jgi:ectoine hydroxylase-related dioxygenase (phytanoyl-CoA dioxygenase family)
MAGSHRLHQQYFDHIGGWQADKDLGFGKNGYTFAVDDLEWYRKNGCEEVKICANAGDLILWDSRMIHWNASPTGDQTRFITYVCYCPRSYMPDDMLRDKLEIFRSRKGTTHWPQMNTVPADRPGYRLAIPRRPDGSIDTANRTRPFKEPEATPEVLKLVGVRGQQYLSF